MDFYVFPFIAAVTSPPHIDELKSRKERLRPVYPAQPCPPFGQCPKRHLLRRRLSLYQNHKRIPIPKVSNKLPINGSLPQVHQGGEGPAAAADKSTLKILS